MYIEPNDQEKTALETVKIVLNFPNYFTAIDSLACIDAEDVDFEEREVWEHYQLMLSGIIGAYRRWMKTPKKGRHQFMIKSW